MLLRVLVKLDKALVQLHKAGAARGIKPSVGTLQPAPGWAARQAAGGGAGVEPLRLAPRRRLEEMWEGPIDSQCEPSGRRASRGAAACSQSSRPRFRGPAGCCDEGALRA